ncbi:MAG TPA: hypothetical protein VF712_18260 [Thermoleophilaceae bacterium]
MKAHRTSVVKLRRPSGVFAGLFVILAMLAAPATAAVDTQPVTAVILVDESGSLSPAAVAAERDAAAALVSSDLSKRSKFMIAGFGSANRPGQSAVTAYCDFVVTSNRAARERLVQCANSIHARKPSEGNDTDHAKAIQFALEHLRGQRGVPAIFLLTDGVLDVQNSPDYGRRPERRTAEAQRRVSEVLLPEARRRGVQVRPLGFGNASRPALDAFAAGGAGVNRRCSGGRPRAVIVHDIAEVIHGLVTSLGGVRCGAVGPPNTGTLGRGGSTKLKVKIPAIATDGAITVVKGDPSFQVDVYQPNGDPTPENGTVNGQTFERSGRTARVESVQITNPIPGDWTVKVSDPRNRASSTRVTTFAIWEGVLQASLVDSPVLPIPGRDIDVQVHVLARNGVLTGDDLDGVKAEAQAFGSFGRVPIPLRLTDGSAFKGRFPLPADAKGALRIEARVSGPGVSSDVRVDPLKIQTSNYVFGDFDLSIPRELHAGDVIHGSITTTNQGPPRAGALQLGEFSPGTLVTLDSSLDRIPAGKQRFPFTITVSKRSKAGSIYAQVVLVADKGEPLSKAAVDTKVVEPPPIPTWVLILAACCLVALLALGFFLWRRRQAKRARTDTRRLVVTLLNGTGESSASRLGPEGGSRWKPRRTIVLYDNDGAKELLDERTGAGRGQEFVIERDRSDVTVRSDDAVWEGQLATPLVVAENVRLTVSEENGLGDLPENEQAGAPYGGAEDTFGDAGEPEPVDPAETQTSDWD